jgi:hypothetical protein
MTKQEIISGLVQGHWSNEDIKDFYEVLKGCRATADAVAKYQFKVGDKVRFKGRGGRMVTGKVTKRMVKNIEVREDGSLRSWAVPPSVLEKIS